MGLAETAEERILFQTRIVLGKNDFFRASLQANCLVYCDSCDVRVRHRLGAGVRYLSIQLILRNLTIQWGPDIPVQNHYQQIPDIIV